MSSLSLPYTFPREPSVGPEIQPFSRDAQVSRDLDINVTYRETKPRVIREPYVKSPRSIGSSPDSIILPQNNALDDILASSQQAIEAYILDMPHPKMFAPSEPKTPQLTKKRSRKVLEAVPFVKEDNADERIPKTRKTPVKAKSLKNKVLEQAHVKHNDDEGDTSSQDPLACHAENIMRMAMDSTMMSSFNNSFSSTFSNLNEDSILGKRNQNKENSFIGRNSNLDKQRSTMVEISALDLEQAVSEPYFK